MKLPDLFDTTTPPPRGMPPLDVLGGHAAALHVSGDALDPDQVSNLFGTSPTESEVKDMPQVRADGSEERVAKAGRWSLGLATAGTGSMNFNEAIEGLLGRLPEDAAIWRAVGKLGSMHIALSLAVDAGNGEVWLDPRLLSFLGERGVGLYFEIYQRERALDDPQYY